jgi:hypothetical protein
MFHVLFARIADLYSFFHRTAAVRPWTGAAGNVKLLKVSSDEEMKE